MLRKMMFAALLIWSWPAHATFIEFFPKMSIDTPGLTIENLSIATADTSFSATGSGVAFADITSWQEMSLAVSLGGGPGSATASLESVATFDLVFPFGTDGIFVPVIEIGGPIETDPGDTSFASWDLFFDFGGEIFGESQDHGCLTGAEPNSCLNFFDFSSGAIGIALGPDLRVPVTAVSRFDIGVARAAVPEPNMLILALAALAWIGSRRRRLKTIGG